MAFTVGSRIGSYEIVGLIGAGGMGEVYRARDSHLKREVALKTLPDPLAADPERLARFEREAQVLASLNHPNIASIHGMEPGSGNMAPVLVMEFVDGPTLADRIAHGPLPLDEALGIAREIAAGLDAAHAQGVVHRDLKPANIKLRDDGTVKILDFGLAKATLLSSTAETADVAQSPTITSPAMTQAGIILGTAAYMAPEQARGRVVDKRADIWAFGCVLYEMVTGKRPLGGEDLTLTLAAIIRDAPDLSIVPLRVRRLIEKCLEKDPRQRLRDIGDAFELLEGERHVAVKRQTFRWGPWAIAAATVIAAIMIAAPRLRPASPLSVMRFEIDWPRQSNVAVAATGNYFFQVSPNGQYFAIASDGMLWVRSIDEIEAMKIEKTEGASYPAWSPDSESIVFFADNDLKRVSRRGGPVQRLCHAADARGVAWAPDGTIVFSDRSGSAGLSKVSSSGGEPSPLTTITNPRASEGHRYPSFLPDGRRFLFLHLSADPEVGGIYIGSLDGTVSKRIMPSGETAVFAPGANDGGYLLFVHRDNLMARAFDAAAGTLQGDAFAVAENVGEAANTGFPQFTVSRTGLLAYGEFNSPRNVLVWVDREGKAVPQSFPSVLDETVTFELDSSQTRAAIVIQERGSRQANIWLQNKPATPLQKFTVGPEPGWNFPSWSPQQDRLAFATNNRFGFPKFQLLVKNLRGNRETKVFESTDMIRVWDWLPDGSSVIFNNARNLWLARADGSEKPLPLTTANADETYARVSPDGQWLAYTVIEKDAERIYLKPLRGSQTVLLSADGGSMPRWRPDGKGIFYRSRSGLLREALLRWPDAGATSVEIEAIKSLAVAVPIIGNVALDAYVPSTDGQRFLIIKPSDERWQPMTVVTNWLAAAKIQ